MNILILPDSFKDCLSSVEVGKALAEGVLRVFPSAEIKQYPVADGGEGTVEAFVAATGGQIVTCKAHDALGREIDTFYGLLPDGTAIVEMAAASGIQLLNNKERNPMVTSSYGTGEIILAALKNEATQIILGLGGSVTNDGGTGMARALGYQFHDASGHELSEGGGALDKLKRIDATKVSPLVTNAQFKIACDVQNPLTGNDGASAVYGPQKGATPDMVKSLDSNLSHLAKIIKQDLGADIEAVPGGGAAGGMGAGCIAFLDGELAPGFNIITETLQLDEKVAWADIVLTGEGKMDGQTLQGKTPYAVAQLAKAKDKKALAFAGMLGEGYRELYNHGFDAIFPIAERPMSLEESLRDAKELLSNASERAFRMLR